MVDGPKLKCFGVFCMKDHSTVSKAFSKSRKRRMFSAAACFIIPSTRRMFSPMKSTLKKASLVFVNKVWKYMFESVSNRLGCYFIIAV